MNGENERKKELMGYLAVMAAGLFICIWGGIKLWQALESRFWPTCQGTVLVSETRQTYDRIGEPPSYYAHVVFSYAVNGHSYTSDDVSFAEYATGDRSAVEKIVRRYPAGREVLVHYDSDNPQRAVLESGVSTGNVALLAVGLVMMGIGGLLFWGTWKGLLT